MRRDILVWGLGGTTGRWQRRFVHLHAGQLHIYVGQQKKGANLTASGPSVIELLASASISHTAGAATVLVSGSAMTVLQYELRSKTAAEATMWAADITAQSELASKGAPLNSPTSQPAPSRTVSQIERPLDIGSQTMVNAAIGKVTTAAAGHGASRTESDVVYEEYRAAIAAGRTESDAMADATAASAASAHSPVSRTVSDEVYEAYHDAIAAGRTESDAMAMAEMGACESLASVLLTPPRMTTSHTGAPGNSPGRCTSACRSPAVARLGCFNGLVSHFRKQPKHQHGVEVVPDSVLVRQRLKASVRLRR